jgi:hypothetical protein
MFVAKEQIWSTSRTQCIWELAASKARWPFEVKVKKKIQVTFLEMKYQPSEQSTF